MLLTDEEIEQFCQKGFVSLKSVIDCRRLDGVVAVLTKDEMQRVDETIDSRMTVWMGRKKYSFPKEMIVNLFEKSCLFTIVEQMIGKEFEYRAEPQIALRLPYSFPDEEAHVDGFGAGQKGPFGNGIPEGEFRSFNLLVGIALTVQSEPNSGNLTLFPGSHWKSSLIFQKDQTIGPVEFMKEVTDGSIAEHVLLSAGDAIICHGLSAHRVTENMTSNPRINLYWRCKSRTYSDFDSCTDLWRDFHHTIQHNAIYGKFISQNKECADERRSLVPHQLLYFNFYSRRLDDEQFFTQFQQQFFERTSSISSIPLALNVNLERNDLTDRSLQQLVDFLNQHDIPIEILRLGQNPHLTKECLSQIIPLFPKLQKLNLRFNPTIGVGFQSLSNQILSMPHFSGALRVLGLSGCGIGDTEIDAIARMLPSLKELKEITLHGNEITDVGAKSMGLGLRFSPWIEQIGMNGNLLTATGLFHLFSGISIPNSQMKRLYLGWNAIDSNGDALRFLEKAIDQILSGRTFRQPMEILSLPYNDLCDAGAKQFAKLVACGAVHTLDLESNHLTDVGVQCLLHSLQQCRPSVAFLGLCEQLLLPATLQSAHEVFKEKKLRPEHFLDPIVLHRCRNPSMRRRLFHITTQENAFKIQESKELHCGKDGMFGPGIYFARTPSEALGKTIHGLLTSNLGEKPSSEVYVIECMVSLPWKMKVLHSPLSSKEMEDIPVAERCFLSACTDTIEWIVADSQRVEVLDVYPIAAQNDVSRLLHTSPFDYSDKGWHAAAVHVVFLCTDDDEKDVSVLRIFQELEELVKAAGRKIASFVCSAAQTNALVEDFIRRVELSEGDLVIARCELFSQIGWIHDNLQYFQEVFGGVTTIVLKRKPFSSSSSSPVLDNSDEIILDSLQVSQCNQQTLQKFIEQNILARVLPGVKLLVLESSSFYDKFMKPLQEKAKLLSLLEGAIEVSDRNVLRFTKEGEPLWHVIFTTRGDAWILLPNSAHHPPGIQWRFTATSSDSCHEESVLQQRCSFIAWWIHPHFVTLEWKQKLEFLMNHPPMYSEEIPFSSSWLLDMFEVSNVSKPSSNYLHTIRDFSLPEHLQSLTEMHSETLQWLTSKLGVEKSQISSFVHYPNGLPVTTLHIHYRLNISDELTLPEDQPGKTIFLSNATPSDSTYGFQSLRSLPLETILQWLQESPTALQQYPFRYSVWTCRPCWQSTLASKESSFVIYNGKLALLGDASSDISQKFEQLLTRQGCKTTFANDHHQVIATDPSNESFFQKFQVIDCLPKSGFVSEKIVFVSVVGDSGAGKDTGLSFCRNNPDISEMFFMPKRVISRVSRGNDTETAISVTTEQFRQMSINGEFAIEYWHPTFPGLGYALLKTDVDFAINQRKSIMMNIGRFALQYLRTWCNQRGIIFTVILVKAPVNELEQRIRSRGRDVEADIYHRVEGAKKGTFRIYRAQSEHVFEIYNDSTREIYEERMKLALQCCAVVGKK